jgi:spermidine/putrescine-binding protein
MSPAAATRSFRLLRVRRVKRAMAMAAALVIASTTAACGGLSSSGSDGQSLVVVNWKGYGSDLAWATERFEEKTGATVTHRYISSEAELVELLRNSRGSVDVALPNFQFIGPAIREGLIQKLDESRLESLNEVFPALAEQDAFRSGGALYGVPWVWGYSSVFYNTEKIRTAPTTVADLWDPRYKGKVAMVDDATLNVLLACMYLGEDPSNPDLEKVKQALLDLKANSALITASPDELAKAIASETVTIGYVASSYVGGFQAEGLPVGFTVPEEGAVGWGDTWTIAAGTSKEDLAYKWVNLMTSSEFEAQWASDPAAGSPAPANEAAVAQLSDANRERLQADPATLGRLTLQGPMPDKQLNEWLDVWAEVKGS